MALEKYHSAVIDASNKTKRKREVKKPPSIEELAEQHGITPGEGYLRILKECKSILDEGKLTQGHAVTGDPYRVAKEAMELIAKAENGITPLFYARKQAVEHSGGLTIESLLDAVAEDESAGD